MTDEDRHADEVNIAFQMGAEWQRDRMKARIKQLEAALLKIADTDPDDGTSWFHDIACKALEGKND